MYVKAAPILRLLAGLVVLFSTSSQAWELSSNGVTKSEHNQYRVTGSDPYFEFTNTSVPSAQGYWLSVDVLDARKSNRRPHLQIYWADKTAEFSASKMMTASLQNASNRVYLPVSLLETSVDSIRLDLENCRSCLVQIQPPVAASPPSDPSLFADGLEQYLRINQGFDIDVSDWFGQELDNPQAGKFTFAGWDPRIINNTPFSLPADRAAGIYLEFDYNSAGKFQTYELFWYLQGLPWNALRSAHFMLENDGDPRKRIFLPFDRIGSSRSLNHLRFDFEACEACELSLITTRLVGARELSNYDQFTPQRLYYVHTEVPPGRAILSNIGEKMLKDWGFLLAWLVILLSSLTFGIRRIKALGN